MVVFAGALTKCGSQSRNEVLLSKNKFGFFKGGFRLVSMEEDVQFSAACIVPIDKGNTTHVIS